MDYAHIIRQFPTKSILVVGDFMLDKYAYGTVTRISPEAPVPVLHFKREENVPGGAGNVAHNLAALGATVHAVGITGNDLHREQLLATLRVHGVNCDSLMPSAYPTIVKHRWLSDNHQLLRVDYEECGYVDAILEQSLIAKVTSLIPLVDAIVVADYAKGTVSEKLAQHLVSIAIQHAKFIIADTKPKHKMLFRNVTVLKVNAKEAIEMTNAKSVEQAGIYLRQELSSDIVISRGSQGISVFEKEITSIPTRVQYVYDVTGAGDTVNAVLTLAKISGATLVESAIMANRAGSIVVQKPATSVVFPEELCQALDEKHQ